MSAEHIRHDLLRIGAVRFGRFELSGVTQPIILDLHLLPSYPKVLFALASLLAPLVQGAGLSHILATPDATPIGIALALQANMPLIYPAPYDHESLEGAYDYNAPTVLLTAVLADGEPETKLIAHARKQGLDVEAVVAVIDLGWCETISSASHSLRPISLLGVADLLAMSETVSSSMRQAVSVWLARHRLTDKEAI